jgi:hypothetical protein
MQRLFIILLLGVFAFNSLASITLHDTISIKGQLSLWGHYNFRQSDPFSIGGRYLPQLNYMATIAKSKQFDIELSANAYGSIGDIPEEILDIDKRIKVYRAWARYSGQQYEFRLGLQKINFGSASMLRPLMWFDKIDPRDPLQLTDGVWGMLGRYYFLNNANLWFWALHGNKEAKTWEIGNTYKGGPEFGARIQHPFAAGEAGLSFHHRLADMRSLNLAGYTDKSIPENRLGLDGRWDVGAGLWFEAVWIKKQKEVAKFSNQEMINVGFDYTFRIGNGLSIMMEHLLYSNDSKPFAMSSPYNFSSGSLSYPLGLFDHLTTLVYYDWTRSSLYSFINYRHQFKKISLYCMFYKNPETYAIPLQTEGQNSYSGTGIQIMLVYNH